MDRDTLLSAVSERLSYVVVYNNDDLSGPYRLVAIYENGKSIIER